MSVSHPKETARFGTGNFTCLLSRSHSSQISRKLSCLHPIRQALRGILILFTVQALATTTAGHAEDGQLKEARRLRDDFVLEVKHSGYSCSLQPQDVVLANRASFGQYDESSNRVKPSDWFTLPLGQRTFFSGLTAAAAPDLPSRAVFEYYVHRWTFVHELAHWWQACEKPHGPSTPYKIEIDANRIALAYWRHSDPRTVAVLTALSRVLSGRGSGLVPQGESTEEYFDANDEREHLSAGSFYPWLQSTLILSLASEPERDLAAALHGSMAQ